MQIFSYGSSYECKCTLFLRRYNIYWAGYSIMWKSCSGALPVLEALEKMWRRLAFCLFQCPPIQHVSILFTKLLHDLTCHKAEYRWAFLAEGTLAI